MALLRNSLLAGIVIAAASFSSPVLADDSTISGRDDHRSEYLDDNYIYDYMTHRDSITVGLGDAPTSNIVIQHPTPWPSYINKTRIYVRGDQGVSAIERMLQGTASAGSSSGAAAPSNSSGTGMTSSSGAN